MSARLSPDDRAVVDEAVRELQDGPRPTDRGPLGCALALPGFVLLLVTPPLVRHLELADAVGRAAFWAGLVLLVMGLLLWFTAGGFVRGHYGAAAEAALRGLEGWDPESGDREEALRGATLLVMNAVAAYGPTSVLSVDPEEARRRMGPLLPLVEAVEDHLAEQGRAYRVFGPEAEDAEEDADTGEQTDTGEETDPGEDADRRA